MKPLRELKQGGLLSVVLPSYNEEASIPRAAERITQLLTEMCIRDSVNMSSRPETRAWISSLRIAPCIIC